jgi:hypothetical protein
MHLITLSWRSATGQELQFVGYDPKRTNWHDVPGLYLFGQPVFIGSWKIRYVGQTRSFKDRFSKHEHWPKAAQLGCDIIFALPIPVAADRELFEHEMIAEWSPVLNARLSPLSAPMALRA